MVAHSRGKNRHQHNYVVLLHQRCLRKYARKYLLFHLVKLSRLFIFFKGVVSQAVTKCVLTVLLTPATMLMIGILSILPSLSAVSTCTTCSSPFSMPLPSVACGTWNTGYHILQHKWILARKSSMRPFLAWKWPNTAAEKFQFLRPAKITKLCARLEPIPSNQCH